MVTTVVLWRRGRGREGIGIAHECHWVVVVVRVIVKWGDGGAEGTSGIKARVLVFGGIDDITVDGSLN